MEDDSDEIRVSTARLGDLELAVVSMPLPGRHRLDALTAAEVDVVRHALQGKTNGEIAEQRGVSDRTIANQLASAYRTLGVHSRAELAALLIRGDESE